MPRIRRRIPDAYPAEVGDRLLTGTLAELRRALDLPALWKATVRLLDAALPNFHYVAALPCIEERPIWVSSTVPGSEEPGYWERFISCEPPLGRVLAEAPHRPVGFLDDHWPFEELAATAFFERVMKPEGWRHAAGLLFWENGNFIGHIGLNRTPEQGPYQVHERALLEQIHPHVQDAVRRVAAFDAERAKRAALEEVLRQGPDGLMVLDWELRPVFRNGAAGDACRHWNNGSGGEADLLPTLVKEAAAALLAGSEALLREPPRGKWAGLETEIDHPTVAGMRARVRLLQPRTKQAIKPHCLIEFSRVPERGGREPAVATFSLTTAERRVANLVALGKANPAVAAELNLSVHTIRAHLREIFAKLGIKSRGELMAALARDPNSTRE